MKSLLRVQKKLRDSTPSRGSILKLQKDFSERRKIRRQQNSLQQ